MDTLRSAFDSGEPSDTEGLAADRAWDALDEDPAEPAARRDVPPDGIGQDERRMQVRAYNHWASLLGERMFPLIDDLDLDGLTDFGPHSVLLDFTNGIDNPGVRFLGDKLARECSADGVITRLSDVPPRSLLSRITDHYMQILANQAPIGFEAEFVNQRGVAILYRGILLPFSNDEDTITYIYGVINWKEMADQLTADELLLEIDQALELEQPLNLTEALLRAADPVTDWADSPAHEEEEEHAAPAGGGYASLINDPMGEDAHSLPDFDRFTLSGDDEDYDEDEGDGDGDDAGYSFASLADYIEAPIKKAIDPTEFDLDPELDDPFDAQLDAQFEADESDAGPFDAPVFRTNVFKAQAYEPEEPEYEEPEFEAPEAAAPEPRAPEPRALEPRALAPRAPAPVAPAPVAAVAEDEAEDEAWDDADNDDADDSAVIAAYRDEGPHDGGLYDCLASARELARTADTTEDRSRSALYAAVSRAYDFSLAAEAAPQDFAALIATSGLTVQDRAPMTPIVKLVFGHEYDKTRLTEYAAVLTHAHRLKLQPGRLAGFLARFEGGLKAVVKAERRLRREEQGKPQVEEATAVREALAQQLRALEAITLEDLDGAGPEFALVLIRRDEIGCAEILAELPEEVAAIERAARKLFG